MLFIAGVMISACSEGEAEEAQEGRGTRSNNSLKYSEFIPPLATAPLLLYN